MKIPTSSSILLATLAISSSSSCLAAPTGTGHHDTGMASSPSFSTAPASEAYHTGMNSHERSDTIVQRNAGFPVQLENRDLLPSSLLDALGNLRSILNGVLHQVGLSLDVDSSGSGQGLTQQQLDSIKSAVDEASRQLAAAGTVTSKVPSPVGAAAGTVTSKVPSPVGAAAGTVTSTVPLAAMSNDDGSGSNSISPSGASSSASAPGPTASVQSDGGPAPDSSAGAGPPSSSPAPPSPSLPPGPPNSPAN